MCSKCGNNPLSKLELDADCRRTFWVEAPLCLLTDFSLIPRADMTLEEKMNTITRIVLVVWILLLIFGHRRANLFLIIALVVIVLLYYARRRRLQQEGIQKLLKALGAGDHCQQHRNAEEHHRGESKHRRSFRNSNIQSRSRDSDDSDSDSDSSDSSSSSSSDRHENRRGFGSQLERHHAHQPKEEPDRQRNDGFERFEATAGNNRYAAQTTSDQRPNLPAKSTSRSGPRRETVYEEVENDDAAPEDLPETDQVDVDQELVQTPITRKSAPASKRNPRKPYPLTVSPSMEVRAARQENLMKSYRGGAAPHAGSKFHGYQTKNFQDEEGPSIRYVNRRLRGTVAAQASPPVAAPSQTVEMQEDERYVVMAENDDAELEDDQDNVDEDDVQDGAVEPEDEQDEEPEPVAPPQNQRRQVQAVKKRVFLPANYDGFIATPAPEKSDRPKLTRHGAMRGNRVPTKHADSNQVSVKYNANDLMFNRAAKLERETNARLKANRKSQINGMFGI